ncbi:hypothetical protein EV715DRAFT_268831 [Schizophyllum commune]
MGPSDAVLALCRCTICVQQGPEQQGLYQQRATARNHYSRDDQRYGWPAGWSKANPGVPFRAPLVQNTTSDTAPQSPCLSEGDISEDGGDVGRLRAQAEFKEPDNAYAPVEPASLPPTFDDDPAIRGAYVPTRAALKIQLDGNYSAFQRLSESGIQLEGLDNFARTLPTVERRLGVSTDGFIVYLFACPTCWMTYRPAELLTLETATCSASGCDGQLYSLKRMASGKEKRTPNLTVPFVRPSSAIARMCLQPGKVEQWQLWRGAGDEVGPITPSTSEGYDAFADADKPMSDVSDGWAWRTVMAGLQRRRNGTWEVHDVDVHQLNQRFVSLPNGLLLQINIDWFQAVKGACHSTGALYTTILNNPRGIRYLREETQLSMMFPGPNEPTLHQQNNVMHEYQQDIALLYEVFSANSPPRKEFFHAAILSDVSDLPASRKTSAIAGCTTILFMCPRCQATMYSLTCSACFDRSAFILRDPARYLKYSFRSKELGLEREEEIFTRRGVRYSVMHELPGWLPGITGVVDFMHCVYLCMVKHLCKDILLKTSMIDTKGSSKMEDFYRILIWPPSMSRMPPSISRGAGSIKADNWKTQIIILFIALFVAWQVDGTIPDGDAPLPAANTKVAKALDAQQRLVWKRMKADYRLKNPHANETSGPSLDDARMDRSYRRHYEAILQFTAAIRILSSHKISPNDVKRGTAMQSRAVQAWARMHCHLTPYFHLAMHFDEQFYRLGPCTGWWTYPYERNNGFLGRFNTNGHSGGELECTMMRGWWKTSFIQEFITHLQSLPAPRARDDADSISLLEGCLRGGTSDRHSSSENYQARLTTSSDYVRFPKQNRQINLRDLATAHYRLVYHHLRTSWAAELDLIRDSDMPTNSKQVTFFGQVKSYPYLWLDNRRYGTTTSTRGLSARFGYINNRVPVEIEYLLEAEQTDLRSRKTLRETCAIVRRFVSDEDITALGLPWDLWATDLGVRTWRAATLAPPEVVSVIQLTGHFVIAPLDVSGLKIWVTVAYDCESPEEDFVED